MNRQDFELLFENRRPMAYGKLLKTRPEYMAVVDDYCKDFDSVGVMTTSEKIWLYMHEEVPHKCPNNNPTKFKSYVDGYQLLCANDKACGCHKIIKGQIMRESLAKKGITQFSDINIAIAAREEKYGVGFAGHPSVRAKIEATNKAKYGSVTPFGDSVVQAKAQAGRKNKDDKD